MGKKVILLILDGWGNGDHSQADAIYSAHPAFIQGLMKRYPTSVLRATATEVGLPEGQMGNSEVGHLNMGAGRVIYQDLVRINKAIAEDTIRDNVEIRTAFEYAKAHHKAVHFIGLVSDGGVHSLNKHLYKLCDLTKDYGLERVFVHALTDGRDTDPKSGLGFIRDLQYHLATSNGQLASVCGRYYAMDRDKRWERIKVAYDLLVKGVGEPSHDVIDSMRMSYEMGVTDEFIKPIVCVDQQGAPLGTIQPDEVVFCFNFRTDRLRELTTVLSQHDMPDFDMKTLPLYFLTMTRYDDSFTNVHVAYDKDNLHNTLGEIIAAAHKKQIRIAETEKYAHVTFFFNGGREEPFAGEKRILVQSPKVATYDLKPEMSAYEVTEKILPELQKNEADFICLNFANGDMVGHTGVYSAIEKAVKTIDECVQKIVETAQVAGYDILITADHGNADHAVNADGSPNTAHSMNTVPFIAVADEVLSAHNGVLADIAPTVLQLMGLPQPTEMTGKSLVELKS